MKSILVLIVFVKFFHIKKHRTIVATAMLHRSSKRRISLVNFGAYHISNEEGTSTTGGSELFFLQLATHLGKTFDVSLITGDFGQGSKIAHEKILLHASVDVYSKNHIANIFRLMRVLHRIQADTYITSVSGKEIFFVWLYCKLFRKQFIYVTSSDNECNTKNIREHFLFGRLFQIALEHASLLIVPTNDHRNLLATYHPKISCPIIQIGFGIPYNYDATKEKKTILWLARCTHAKKPLLFLDLAKAFPQEQFVMVAALQHREKLLFEQVQQEAAKIPNVTFIPGVPYAESQRYYDEAIVSVNTSDFEGFPLAFIQSWMGGTPVLSLQANPDQVLTKNNLGNCANGDIEIMKLQLQKMLSEKESWKQKADSISTYVERNHNIQTIAKEYEELLRQDVL